MGGAGGRQEQPAELGASRSHRLPPSAKLTSPPHRWTACHNKVCQSYLSSLSESGCLYGCSGSLEGASEADLEQVHQREDCKVYCKGLLTQRGMIKVLKDTEQSLENDAHWVGGCLEGCLGGYGIRTGDTGRKASCPLDNLSMDRATVHC